METRNLALACFIGGALCCVVALLFTPNHWWLGLVAGFAGGYISYKFREVLKAIPIALRAAGRGGTYVWDGIIASTKAWLSRPHPFFYLGMLLTLPLAIWITPWGLSETSKVPQAAVHNVLVGITYVLTAVYLGAPFGFLAFIGARAVERCYWTPTMLNAGSDQQEYFAELREKGYREVPITYANAARWIVKGIFAVIVFFAWTMWRYSIIGIRGTLCFLARFFWHLFRLIHSKERVLCAIDGTLGGMMAYIWLVSVTTSFAGQVILVLFGGFLGATFGVANYEIVSKKILRVVPVKGA